VFRDKCTICFDFDGVLHEYLDREADFPTPGGVPVLGARQATWDLHQQGYSLVIFSARANEPEGEKEIKNWLQNWAFPDIQVSLIKPQAALYIDDRGFRFEGPQSFAALGKLLKENPIPGRWGKNG
jgi:hypothetical protein